MKSKYIMEKSEEFERLERQSRAPAYDYRAELQGIELPRGARVLDAGCGSGIVSRYLAEKHPDATVIGCDASEERLEMARQAAAGFSNLSFKVENVTKLGFADNSFDLVIFRYVLQHLDPQARDRALSEAWRCLKQNGSIVVIDLDGGFFNIYPRPKIVDDVLASLARTDRIDMHVGRKLPHLLAQAGFERASYRVQALEFHGDDLILEREMLGERLAAAREFLVALAGGESKADEFTREYLNAVAESGTTLFYNKFVVVGTKPRAIFRLNVVK